MLRQSAALVTHHAISMCRTVEGGFMTKDIVAGDYFLGLCIVTWGLSGSTALFPDYHINGTILGRKLFKVKCTFRFSIKLF
jgi:hypothetical protein